MAATSRAQQARIALQRFGLGAKPGGFSKIAGDPIAAVKAELDNPDIASITDTRLQSYATVCRLSQLGFDKAEKIRSVELEARMRKHLGPVVGFVERLVLFWSNHFSMSINKSETVRGTLGHFERAVVRRNVLGNFQTMLKAAIQHPAMIDYLDNDDSIGPNSIDGKNWNAGLNENLAREIMELHTLGSGAGYDETDVTQLAKIITGWSFVRGWEAQYHYNGGKASNNGQFIFRTRWHEPGHVKLRGKLYGGAGMKQGLDALTDLATARETAEHIAFKLVLHFVTDDPTPAMVKPVADAFYKTRGNLKATYLALLDLPEAFTLPLGKVRRPYELAVAQMRALGFFPNKDNGWAVTEPLRAMNNLPWEHPTPDGYADESSYWLDPDGMTIRLDTAMMTHQVFNRKPKHSASDLARFLFGSTLSEETRRRIAGAPDANARFTTLLISSEFQRR
ncbi:DUF1800 domain-containing protein [Oharaeibacter diazotrophicus]|uniref:Uncharacterized protein (DUF1800 family) n=1 Tax=Oharaeibacter diazotrophicus TaxID=1920512 RepID=A0A4R6RLS2_9HYPH|nr:DUF1800 domain-containing protein [Oharaeibacter diazotrophicus]TDP87619.1 uncharacterized protein (DUF1800 family) [Oharaeibacter diazotrophicus]BBE74798.1 hypothetical protein OHA_1_04435 [Pleomorphomonas sp. SM30]